MKNRKDRPAMRRRVFFAIFGVSMIVLPAMALFPGFQVLAVGSGEASMWLPAAEGDLFSHGYTHSMYGAAVTEQFRVGDGVLRLFHVMTESEAVLEYFAIEKKGENNVEGTFKAFSIPAASIGNHVLRVADREIDPAWLHAQSGAISITLTKTSPMAYFLTHFWR